LYLRREFISLENKSLLFEGWSMENKNALLFAVREARKNLKSDVDFRAADMLAIFEGVAPFLDWTSVLNMKCKGCDSYSCSHFLLSNDFWTVENQDYCHAKNLPLKHLSVLKMAGCTDYSQDAQRELSDLVNSVLEEDLRPAFVERRLYDRNLFASYSVAFRVQKDNGNVCIEFGHRSGETFVESDIKLRFLRRLNPGLGPAASERIAKAMKNGNSVAMVVEASLQTRRMLDVDYVLEWIAKKRKMDIVYL
jgi:hypothetical protein